MATSGNGPAPTGADPPPSVSLPPPTEPTPPGPTAQPPPSSKPQPPPPSSFPPPSTTPTPNPPPETTNKPPPTSADPPPESTSQPQPPPTESTSTTTSDNNTTTIITPTVSTPPPTGTQSPGPASSGPPSMLPPSPSGDSGSGGLSAAGTIAVAVVVPVASVALIILVLLWWWRKRKARKIAEEERKQEIEEYRFNPNHDPLLPAVGLSSNFDEGAGMNDGNTGGYRGWGTTTSTSRKLSTNLSSGAGGITVSDTGSNPGPPRPVSPLDDSIPYEDDHRPISGDYSGFEPAAGVLPHANGNNNNNARDIHRGPSNASSAYSNANRSDMSDDIPMPGVAPGTAQYYDDPYYTTEGAGQTGGPFVDNSYGAPPVIRDVQARRNTRIENPSVFPQQGNAGIAQNF